MFDEALLCDPTIENELYEPLNSFDDDTKEMMIDVVNEKVRRILSLDPAKFVNGKLPFGLRPDTDDKEEQQKIVDLEAALRAANETIEDLRAALGDNEGKLELARRRRVQAGPVAAPSAQEPGIIEVPIKGDTRAQVLQLMQEKKVLEDDEERFQSKIAALEAQIRVLEAQLSEFGAKTKVVDGAIGRANAGGNGASEAFPDGSEDLNNRSCTKQAVEAMAGMDEVAVAKKITPNG